MKIHGLIKSLIGRPIAYHKVFADVAGSVTAGVLLAQMYYWADDRMGDPDGWMYKTAKAWTDETGLTSKEQATARRRLRKFDWWQEEKRKANGAPTIHYRLDLPLFYDHLAALVDDDDEPIGKMDLANRENGFSQSAKWKSPIGENLGFSQSAKTINIDYTETTSETTAGDDGFTDDLEDRRPGGPPTPPPKDWNFDGDCGPSQTTETPADDKPVKVTRRRSRSGQFDPRKVIDGYIPAGLGATPFEVLREVAKVPYTKPKGQFLADEITDLEKWRTTVDQWVVRRGYKPTNLDGMIQVYKEGWNTNDLRTNGRNSTPGSTTTADLERQVAGFTALNQWAVPDGVDLSEIDDF